MGVLEQQHLSTLLEPRPPLLSPLVSMLDEHLWDDPCHGARCGDDVRKHAHCATRDRQDVNLVRVGELIDVVPVCTAVGPFCKHLQPA